MHRLIIALATGLWGGVTMLAMDFSTPPDMTFWRAPGIAFVGAAIAGSIVAPIFLRAKPFWSVLAALTATFLGSILAGMAVTLSDRLFGSLAGAVWGPMMVFISILSKGLVSLVWLTGGVSIHLMAKRLAQSGRSAR
jgi:hypothetical protein